MKTFVLNGWAASEDAWKLCSFPRDRVFSYVDQLAHLPEAAIRDTDDGILLVGWSMGGSSALRLFLEFADKVRALVLVAATPRMMRDDGWEGMSPRRLEALKRGLELTHGEGFFGIPEGRPNPYMLDTEENLNAGLKYLVDVDLRARLMASTERLGIPVRIFQSERDGIVPAGNARFLAEAFPCAKVTMVPGMEHALPIMIPELIDSAVEEMREYEEI